MIEYSSTSTIRVGRRPQRSAARPKMKAPIGRIARVSRIASVTLDMSVSNSCAMSLSTNTSRKKSKASSDHPRKLAATTCLCSLVQPESAAMRIVQLSSLAVMVISALSSFDTGHPLFALLAAVSKACWLAPGTRALTSR